MVRASSILFLHLVVCRVSQGIRTVRLIGEPKSGTTWLEKVFHATADIVCAAPSDEKCMKLVDVGSKGNRCSCFSLSGGNGVGVFVRFTKDQKHVLPGAGKCIHGALFATTGPCQANHTFPAVPALSEVTECASRCPSNAPHDAEIQYVHINRDPRDMAVSLCYYMAEGVKTMGLESCVKQFYANVATSMKFRDLYLGREPLRSHVIELGYEAMKDCGTQEFLKVANSLSLLHLKSAPELQQDLKRVAFETSAEATRSHHHGGGRKYKATTLRDGGSRTYQDYGLSDEVVSWMDAVHESLDFGRVAKAPGSCETRNISESVLSE